MRGDALVDAISVQKPRLVFGLAGRKPYVKRCWHGGLTDVDGDGIGAFDIGLNGSRFLSLRGGAYPMQATAEGEWLQGGPNPQASMLDDS
jgi:hypothetical protein